MPEQWERNMGPKRQRHEDIYRMERGVGVTEAVSVYAGPESFDGKRERGAEGKNAGGSRGVRLLRSMRGVDMDQMEALSLVRARPHGVEESKRGTVQTQGTLEKPA